MKVLRSVSLELFSAREIEYLITKINYAEESIAFCNTISSCFAKL